MTTRSTTTDPPVAFHEVADPQANTSYSFRGQHLAAATSQWQSHNHPEDRPVLPGGRCSACRWTSIDIYRADLPDRDAHVAAGGPRAKYLVVVAGQSAVPGETPFVKVTWTNSPYEVLEVITQRKGGVVFLPGPAARALSQAAEYDDGINDAYVNRAVS